jgi:hypothetical protein
MVVQNGGAALRIGRAHPHHAVEAAGAAQRGINGLRAIGGGEDGDAAAGVQAVEEDEELGDQALLMLGVGAAAGRGDAVQFVDEDETRRRLLRAGKDLAQGLLADLVAVSPTSVYRVLRDAGVLYRATSSPSKKGTGFEQPLCPHTHWHNDISYLNVSGTFYYLCSVLDGASLFIVH